MPVEDRKPATRCTSPAMARVQSTGTGPEAALTLMVTLVPSLEQA
jgi:hypothetical protein